MHPPCHRTSDGAACGLTIDKLKPSGVLVVWSVRRYDIAHRDGSFMTPPVTSLTIDGHRATEQVGTGGECTGTMADATVSADIDPGNGTAYSLLACLRGPNLTAGEEQVQTMLSSVKVTPRELSSAFTLDNAGGSVSLIPTGFVPVQTPLGKPVPGHVNGPGPGWTLDGQQFRNTATN
jgi:hypothetical protein